MVTRANSTAVIVLIYFRFSLLMKISAINTIRTTAIISSCLLYTSDAADERSSVDLGGRRIIKKKKKKKYNDAHSAV